MRQLVIIESESIPQKGHEKKLAYAQRKQTKRETVEPCVVDQTKFHSMREPIGADIEHFI